MSSDSLKISQQTLEGDIIAVALNGPISVHTYEKLEAALDEILKAGHYNIIIDMMNVRYVSSAGAGVLMNTLSQSRENNGKVVLMNLSENVQEIFELLSLSNVLPLAEDLDSALALFQAPVTSDRKS
jgi:anti-sigma B factor antagonist